MTKTDTASSWSWHLGRLLAVGSATLLTLTSSLPAAASTGLDSPEIGVSQAGRGSAWVARADDPMAAYMNPAALVTQASGVHVGAHLLVLNRCFTRRGPGNTPVPPSASAPGTFPAPGTPGGPPAAVCMEGGAFPNPQAAATFRITDDLAIGLAVLGPHSNGAIVFPETVTEQGNRVQPAAQRYQLVSSDSLILSPTLSVSYAITPELSLGAGFIWGVGAIDVVNFSEATSSPGGDDFNAHQDLKSRLRGVDAFMPGFVLGALWSPTSRLDVGAWFKWQDALRTSTRITIESLYWSPSGGKNEQRCAGAEAGCNVTDAEDAGTFHLRIPMEARLGFRYHHPRAGSARPAWASTDRRVRDPMSEDLFDVEVDFTWAHNSVVDAIEVRFKPNTIPVRDTPGFVPANADIPHAWRDVFGVRVGGDVVVLPNLLSLRGGGFYETKGQDDAYLNVDFHLGWRLGVAGGATARLGPIDLSVAYQHTFFGALDNGGEGKVKALSGDAATGYRSVQAINGGRLTSSLNEVGLSGTMRF
ncbi:OmpP1/FadL family transporter [Chondromyces crocatus]|nr:outer membrane protein transport protein [Chondromyces crocatus]